MYNMNTMTTGSKRTLINWLGLTGVVAFVSYLAAMIFSPLAYPGYDWMRQAVSDLSAKNAPSLELWNLIAYPYQLCSIISVTLACIFVQGKLNRTLRIGVDLVCAMQWITSVGYSYFPLSDSGFGGKFQDVMHMVITALVVGLSIASLILIMVGGYRKRRYVSLAVCATVALALMFIGSIMSGIVPIEYFGVFERFSTLAAVAFEGALGLYLFSGFKGYKG